MNIHDHFGGSAHCVECSGSCRLTGDERAVTDLIRWVFEFHEVAHKGWMWDFTKDALRNILGETKFTEFQKRSHRENPHNDRHA